MSQQHRIQEHPILPPLEAPTVCFTFNGSTLKARPGEMISSALYAAGIKAFGHHHRDGGAQGIFCVNGQCSQCTVLVEGRPLKSCMTQVQEGMAVASCEGHPALPADDAAVVPGRPGEYHTQVLVLGGGPAGLCAAIELGKLGISVLVVDDKPALGGKLTLQTHQFFGSVAECWAGTRGVDIGHILAREVEDLPSVEVWLNSSAVGVFADGKRSPRNESVASRSQRRRAGKARGGRIPLGMQPTSNTASVDGSAADCRSNFATSAKVGVVTPDGYRLVSAASMLVALGAREKSLSFPGCDLPGVYGAGAFQTLVNRDLVRAAESLFILGGGNVGLIGAYHALQAGIDVKGLVEAMPQVGGYKVHADKLKRLGVPIWTSHTVLRADPDESGERLHSVTIAEVDARFKPLPCTERTFTGVDTLLIAVGLNPCDELLAQGNGLDLKIYAAGDTAEIAEASAAIFSGRIIGRQIANELGVPVEIPARWPELAEVLRSRPGKTVPLEVPDLQQPVYPVIRCVQEIPCDPCREACPEHLIAIEGSIMNLPHFSGACLGCGQCVTVCPGLAINLVMEDYDPDGEKALLMLPFEFNLDRVPLGQEVDTVDMDGRAVGQGKVIAVRDKPEQDRRRLLLVEVPFEERLQVAGFTIRLPSTPSQQSAPPPADEEDPIVCRCERVRESAIVEEIQAGVRDINQLKALSRMSMGGCGGKTCTELVRRLFNAHGITPDAVTPGTIRPLVAEAPLGVFVRGQEEKDDA